MNCSIWFVFILDFNFIKKVQPALWAKLLVLQKASVFGNGILAPKLVQIIFFYLSKIIFSLSVDIFICVNLVGSFSICSGICNDFFCLDWSNYRENKTFFCIDIFL